jgi:hypothetical protein
MTVAAIVAIIAPAIDEVIATHTALGAKRLLVQALTNTVSSNFVANVLLSACASPAMVDNPEEAGLFAGVADGVAPDPLTGLISANVHFSVAAEGACRDRRIEARQFRRGFC